MELPELTSASIDIVVDNFIDVFEPSLPGIVERVTPGRLKKPLLAAHGLAMLITAQRNGQTRRILMDTANSPVVLFNNLEAMEVAVEEIEALFLSHGHPDHYGGISELLQRRRSPLKIFLHPDSYLPKLLMTPKGRVGPWTLGRADLLQAGAVLQENTGPTLVADMAMITGPIKASVDYETPLPGPKRVVEGKEEKDNFQDEQAMVMKVKNRGLVIISACSHPGITNIIRYAQSLTGENRVAAMDNDDLRRGRPTCHKQFDEATAILAGDGLLTEAFFALAEAAVQHPEQATAYAEITRLIAEASGYQGMVGGQMADLLAEGQPSTLDQVEAIHRLKTGALLKASVRAGAILGGGSPQQIEALTRYGEKFGLIFQITDDLLDVEGESGVMGKPTGKDAIRQKATYPGVLGVAAAKNQARDLVAGALSDLQPFGESAEPLRHLAQYLLIRRQ